MIMTGVAKAAPDSYVSSPVLVALRSRTEPIEKIRISHLQNRAKLSFIIDLAFAGIILVWNLAGMSTITSVIAWDTGRLPRDI